MILKLPILTLLGLILNIQYSAALDERHHKEISVANYTLFYGDYIQPSTQKGRLVDSNGEPLVGASVSVKETKKSVLTDVNGYFTVSISKGQTLVFSFVGFKRLEVKFTGKTLGAITMQQDDNVLSEAVVVGYGVQKKETVVGAVQTIAPDALRIPTSNLSNAIAGRVAGVIAYQRSGEPGADGASFFIRGISTFSGSTSPLIILDGVAVSSADLNALAPEVIESFSILKDATATAIYGSRGANGVMIVTTKSGRNIDKPKINIRLENAMSTPTSVPKFVNGVQFMRLFNEAVLGRGSGEILYSKDKIEGTMERRDPLIYPDVDWYNELFKNNSQNRTLNLNVLGGGKKIEYFMSGTYSNSNGMLKKMNVNTYDNNIKLNRYAFQNNVKAELAKGTTLALRLNTQLYDYHGGATSAAGVFGSVMNANPVDFPIMFPKKDESPGILFGGKTGGIVNNGFANPYAQMVNGYSDNFWSSIIATVDGEQLLDFITKGLKFKALASFKNWSSTTATRAKGINQYYVSSFSKNEEGKYDYELTRIGTLQNETLGTSTATNGDRSLYLQGSLDWARQFGDHSVTGLLLYNEEQRDVNAPGGLVASLPRRRQGLAGRLTYDYKGKYMLETNVGYNGSENFAEGNRFGLFPSLGMGYILSKENYFKPFLKAVDFLKIRGSWGLVGNDDIGGARFVYLSDINLTGSGYTTGVDLNYSFSGPTYARFSNPNITWEVAEKINLGMDISFLKGFYLVVDMYRENRSKIFLTRRVLPDSFGTQGTTVYANLGEMKNQGIDISLDYSRSYPSGLVMSLKGTFTYAHNTILNNDDPINMRFRNLSSVGHPANSLLGYKAERLFIDQAEIDNSPLQQIGGAVQPGDIKYTDITNAIDQLNTISSDDRVVMGKPVVPEIVYAFGPSFKYKKFDFSFLLQGVARTSFFVSGLAPFGSTAIRNVLKYVADNRWNPENPDIYARYPRLSKLDNPNNTAASSYWLRDGSFLKLRNIEMGYTHKFARVYLSGMNVLTFSKFKLWDPERGGGNGLGYPTQRIFNIGFQMGF